MIEAYHNDKFALSIEQRALHKVHLTSPYNFQKQNQLCQQQ